jgi:hypothetical protein
MQMMRDFALQALLDATHQALANRLPFDTPAAGVATNIFARLADPRSADNRPQPKRLPVCRHLDAALDTAERAGGDIAPVAAAFRAVEPLLSWNLRAGAEKAGEIFAKGHANALIVGPGGMEDRRDVWIGASLIAPQVQYIDHHHPPAEVYLVLSPGTWRQEDRPWHEPGIGGTVFNTPDIVHAMKAGEAPLFALWCLLVEEA